MHYSSPIATPQSVCSLCLPSSHSEWRCDTLSEDCDSNQIDQGINTVNIGNGFKLLTTDIEDFLASDVEQLATESKQSFTISSTCTLENMTSYRLDPSRGKAQYAMVTVSGQAGDVFVVELVQLLSEEEARNARTSLLKLLRLAVEINSSNLKRTAPWTTDDSPVTAQKCRELGRCASGEPMDNPFM